MLSTLIICRIVSSAQQDTSYVLDEVIVVDRTYNPFQSIDSSMFMLSPVSNILKQEPQIYLRTYSPGLLQTVALRGNAPHQVAILWNGINLQNTMHGVYDVSLLPMSAGQVNISGNRKVVTANNGSNRGIDISPSFDQQPVLTADVAMNTIQNGHARILLSPKNNQWQSRYFAELQHGQNRFNFPDRTQAGSPRRTLQHGEYTIGHLGTDQQLNWKNHQWNAHVLYTVADRNIPPSLTEGNRFSNQKDSALRIAVDYAYQSDKWKWSVQSALLTDAIQFDTFYHKTTTWINRAEIGFDLGQGYSLETAFVQDLQRVNSLSLIDEAGRSVHDVNVVLSKTWAGLHDLEFIVKQAVLDKRLLPFQGILDYRLQLSHWSSTSIRTGKIVQVPTLNDLYWAGSGNPDLQEEVSRFIQNQWTFTSKAYGWSLTASFDTEYKWIDDYILWVPQANGLWTPSNVKAVDILSIVTRIQAGKQIRHHTLQWTGQAHFLSARNRVVYHPSQRHSIDKQLPYMPIWKAFSTIEWQSNGWYGACRYSYVSERFQTSDNRLSLPAYHLVDISIAKHFEWKKNRWTVAIDLENIFDVYYEQLAFRPMPGRILQTRITYHLK